MSEIVFDTNGKKVNKINWKELWEYKKLLWTFSYRDLRVKYAKTSLGFLWAIFQPLMTLGIFIFIFGKAIKIDTGGIPYSLFALSGMCAWFYFSFVVNQGGNSVASSSQLVSKIYFPRILLPISKSLVGLVDFFIILILFCVIAFISQYPISTNIIYLPLFFIVLYFVSMVLSILVNALVIRFKDFQLLIPFLIQLGMYATPVAYPARLFPKEYIFLYFANPMVGIVEGFRWCLIGGSFPDVRSFYVLLVFIPLFFIAQYVFKKTTDIISDLM